MDLFPELWQLIIEYSTYPSYKTYILINKNSHKAILNIINKIPNQIEIKIETSEQEDFPCDYCGYADSCMCIYEGVNRKNIPFSESKWMNVRKIKTNQYVHPFTGSIFETKWRHNAAEIEKIRITITKRDILLSGDVWYPITFSGKGILINTKELFKNYKQTYDTIVIALDSARYRYVYHTKKS